MALKEVRVKCLDGFINLYLEDNLISFKRKLGQINNYEFAYDNCNCFVSFLRSIKDFDEIIARMVKLKNTKPMGYGFEWPYKFQPGGNPNHKVPLDDENYEKYTIRPIDNLKAIEQALGFYYFRVFGEASIILRAIRVDKMVKRQITSLNGGHPFINRENREMLAYYESKGNMYLFHLQIDW